MHSKKSLILFIGAFLIGLTSFANAQCENKATAPCKLYEDADAVFIGTVRELSYSEPFEEVEGLSKRVLRKKRTFFEIKESFKGISEKQNEFVISTEQIQKKSPTDELTFDWYLLERCSSYEFAENKTYIVFATTNLPSKDFVVSFEQVLLLDDAKIATTYLQNLKIQKHSAILYGKVTRKVKPLGFAITDTIERPIRNTKVEIQSEKQIFTTTTDEKGNYLFSEIPSDEYSVKVDLPERLEVKIPINKLSLSEKSCTEQNIIVLTTGQISGIVFNHDGQPLQRLELELVIASEVGKSKPRKFEILSGQEGKFEFKNIPPAQYLLGYKLDKTCSPEIYRSKRIHSQAWPVNCQPRTFYPGVAEISQAIPINLSEGEEVKDLDFRLLPPLSGRNISGIALTPNGHPIVNADIVLMVLRDEFNESGGLTKTDEYGRFSIRAYNSLKYWVNANIKIKSEAKHSEPMELPLNGDVNGIKLIVSSSGKFCSLCYNKYWKRKGAPQQ